MLHTKWAEVGLEALSASEWCWYEKVPRKVGMALLVKKEPQLDGTLVRVCLSV